MLESVKPVLQAQNVYKAFGRHRVLRGVNFAVYPGTLVGIVGEMVRASQHCCAFLPVSCDPIAVKFC